MKWLFSSWFLDVSAFNKAHNHQNVPQSVRKSDKYEQWKHVVNQERFLYFHWFIFIHPSTPSIYTLLGHPVVIKQFYSFYLSCKFEHFISTTKICWISKKMRYKFVQLKNHKQWIINNDESHFDLTLNWIFEERRNKSECLVSIYISSNMSEHWQKTLHSEEHP